MKHTNESAYFQHQQFRISMQVTGLSAQDVRESLNLSGVTLDGDTLYFITYGLTGHEVNELAAKFSAFVDKRSKQYPTVQIFSSVMVRVN